MAVASDESQNRSSVVTLIGYRGSGKSAVARPLAERLGWEWIDADAEIERRAGRSIREIFADDGEPVFRELERQVLGELLKRERLVIAAGGGAVLDADTRTQMQSAGPIVWLSARVDTLQQRIAGDDSTAARRPDLTSAGGREEIEQLFRRREPVYRECATVSIETDERTVDEVVELVDRSIRGLIGKDTPA